MIELIREWFKLMEERIWLNQIDKAVDRYNRSAMKARAQAYAVQKLVQRYNEIYGKNLGVKP